MGDKEQPSEIVSGAGAAIVSAVAQAAKDTQPMRDAGVEFGKAALTLTRFANVLLIPFEVINKYTQKGRDYLEKKLPEDLAPRIGGIPPEHLVEPRASVAVPILQGLFVSHEEQDLRDMFLSLLATSMDARNTEDVHPSFVDIIKQLSASEARLVRALLTELQVPCVEARVTTGVRARFGISPEFGVPYHISWPCLVDENNVPPDVLADRQRLTEMLDNIVRLNLFVKVTTSQLDKSRYTWTETHPQIVILKRNFGRRLHLRKSFFIRTSFGFRFGKAIGVIPNQ